MDHWGFGELREGDEVVIDDSFYGAQNVIIQEIYDDKALVKVKGFGLGESIFRYVDQEDIVNKI